MKGKILFIALFAFMFLLANASAALVLTKNSAPATVVYNSEFTVSINLSNTDAHNYSSLEWTPTISSNAEIRSFTPITSINSNENKTFNVVLFVPAYKSGNIAYTLSVKNNTGSPSNTLTVNVPINNTAALQVTELKTLNDGVARIKLFNDGNSPLTVSRYNVTGPYNVKLYNVGTTSEPAFSFDIAASGSVEFDVKNTTTLASLPFGVHKSTLAFDTNKGSFSGQVSYTKSFCRNGAVGRDLTIEEVDVNNEDGDDDNWNALDRITVEVTVENNGADDIDDVFVELGLFDSNGKNYAADLFDEDGEEIELGDLKDGDDDSVTFEFVVPADLDAKAYKLTVKAYSDDLGESEMCADNFENSGLFMNVDVEREDDEGKFIAFDDIIVSPKDVVCGDTVRVEADVFNIGEDDQDQVKVILYNKELGVDMFYEITKDLDVGDNERVEFEFSVPKGIAAKDYKMELWSEYDYDDGDYDQESDDPTLFTMKVIGCEGGVTPTTPKDVVIGATLGSSAKAGEELVVNVKITNTADAKVTYLTESIGHESWASLESISERIVTLNAGESRDVVYKFKVNDNAKGTQGFTVGLTASGSDKKTTKDVLVELEGGQTGDDSGDGLDLGGSSLIWIIGAVNLILIILIIVVAVRVSRK